MKNQAKNRDEVFKFILSDKTYEEILRTFLVVKNERDEFRQHLWLQICQLSERDLVKSWNEKYFTYLYVSIIKNQIQSNTSSWQKIRLKYDSAHKIDSESNDYSTDDIAATNRKKYSYEEDFTQSVEQNYIDAELITEKKNKLLLINEALDYHIKLKPMFYLEASIFKMYFESDMSLRDITKKTGIQTTSVFNYVKTAKQLIKQYIKQKNGTTINL